MPGTGRGGSTARKDLSFGGQGIVENGHPSVKNGNLSLTGISIYI